MQKKQNTVQSLRHKTIRNVTVINFKKVVSMVVMLSLMLGACGKSPARRDDNSANNKVIENIVNKDKNQKDDNRKLSSRPGMGAFVGAGAVAGEE